MAQPNAKTPGFNDEPDDGDPEPPYFDILNRQFYQEHGPAEYLLMRLSSLCLIGGEYERFKETFVEGIEFANLPLKMTVVEDPDGDLMQSDLALRDHFVRIEAHHLKHLAIETLLRLFLGHKNLPDCPWYEISRELIPGKFKDKVETQICNVDETHLHSEIARVFMGLSGDMSSMSDDQLDVILNLSKFIRSFAEDWLRESKSYNATKHGLTAVPGSADFKLIPTSEDLIHLGYGDSLIHLSHGQWEGGRRDWFLTTRWIRIEQAIATIHIIYQMLLPLWSVARARYGIANKYHRSMLSSSQYSVDQFHEIESCPLQETSISAFCEIKSRK